MKLTRKQLRKLINEVRIKPSLPDVPSTEYSEKIDDLARQEEFQASADVIAQSFGYPEDRSYSTDLKDYDEVPLLPFIELDNDHMIRYVVMVYESEFLQPMIQSSQNPNHSIESIIQETRRKLTDVDFDGFMKEFAKEIYEKILSSYGPAIFTNRHNDTQLAESDAINRIYHELRRRGKIV